MINVYRFLLLTITLITTNSVLAQRVNTAYQAYIEQYCEVAMEQMRQHKIPASIKLAQGLLESAAGNSQLAKKSNNHFGIKCGGSAWNGRSVKHDDDEKGECFRKYTSVLESYHDHSIFLKKQRYASLFNLAPDDYKGWARGLKAAGYATNPAYAQSLIGIIELYQLHKYDAYVLGRRKTYESSYESANRNFSHQVYFNNDNYYIIVKQGDTFKSIAKEMGVSVRRLVKYNELHKHYQLQEGDIIYMQKKRKRADKAFKKQPHIVTEHESMYTISQKYGIRLARLYRLNRLSKSYTITVGDQLRVY